MPTMTCDRCKNEVVRVEQCNYCGKNVCNSCMKASQKASKLIRLVICKDCWGNMPKRSHYKNKHDLIATIQATAKQQKV